MEYKAIFFDRDGTLTYGNPEKQSWLKKTVESYTGKALHMDYEKMMKLFDMAGYVDITTVEKENAFFKRYYLELLKFEGVTECIVDRAELLFKEMWCNNDKILYPEAIDVLEYFKDLGYEMGVISDTSPSLKMTIQQLGIVDYFGSFTASSVVGAMKPDPKIFWAALDVHGLKPQDCIYVDDTEVEAKGARDMGFTSFYLDRDGKSDDRWTISDLTEIVSYVKSLNE